MPVNDVAGPRPQDEVVRIAQELIRIDSSNYGDNAGPVEQEAADYVVASLTEVGLTPDVVQSTPGRPSVIVRLPGRNRQAPGLCVHGHLDVVPAQAADWSRDPFGGEIADGCLWGRGAVDMKGMDAMILSLVRHYARTGTRPPRDVVIAFFADEEAGGVYGSHYVAAERPELFAGVTEAISEVGGFSVTVPTPFGPRRAYLVQTAEKGIAWFRLRAKGTAGHGSIPTSDNPVVHLASAVSAVGNYPWPRRIIPSVRGLLDGLSELTGTAYSDEDLDQLLQAIGSAQGFVRGTLRTTTNPTILTAGYKTNVVPQEAVAEVDGRFLPGGEDELYAVVRQLAGEMVEVEPYYRGIALEAPFDAPIVEAMIAAIRSVDPDAAVLPYALSGGTDNKALQTLGITGYGFAPLQLPADLDFVPLFHGVDERVPIDSLIAGTQMLHAFIEGSWR